MKQTFTTLALLGMIGATSQAAVATPLASASLDWSSFTYTLFDLDPLDGITPYLTYSYQVSSGFASDYVGATPWFSRDDWTTPLSAVDGPATAQANAGLLAAMTHGAGNAEARRHGNFILSPMTLVMFSVSGSVDIQGGPDQYAGISLATWGTGPSGIGLQSSESALTVWAGPPYSMSGTLSVTFLNLTATDMSGEVRGDAAASAPIPEPETYALMLAGLGLVGWMARRRRAANLCWRVG